MRIQMCSQNQSSYAASDAHRYGDRPRWMAGQWGEVDRPRGKIEKESEAWLDAEGEWMKKREQNQRGIWWIPALFCSAAGARLQLKCLWGPCGFQPINPLHVFNTGQNVQAEECWRMYGHYSAAHIRRKELGPGRRSQLPPLPQTASRRSQLCRGVKRNGSPEA